MFIEPLLCARHFLGPWDTEADKKKQGFCSSGAQIIVGNQTKRE